MVCETPINVVEESLFFFLLTLAGFVSIWRQTLKVMFVMSLKHKYSFQHLRPSLGGNSTGFLFLLTFNNAVNFRGLSLKC